MRENPVTNAVSVNSLYCLPVKKTFSGATTTPVTVLMKNAQQQLRAGTDSGDPTVEGGVVRCASLKLSSKSPFTVKVKNAAQGWTAYECPGQKIVKLSLNRESHVAGNPALFAAQPINSAANQALIQIADAEDQVDITFNVVVDSTLD